MSSELKVDTISEKTTASGVTIDSVLLKDGLVDGVDVSAIVSGSLVKLSSATASNSSELLFDNFVDTSTYHHYKILFEDMLPATANTSLLMVFRKGGASGSDLTGSYYNMAWASFGNIAVSGFDSNGSTANYMALTTASSGTSTRSASGIAEFFPSDGTNDVSYGMTRFCMIENSGNVKFRERGQVIVDNTASTGLRFLYSSGNITSGSIHIYGVKK